MNRKESVKISHVNLGNTGILVSKLGIGTVKFGRNIGVNYPKQFNIPDDKDIKQLLTTAKELNINFLDTAPAYGNSEERLGIALQNERQKWIICNKVGEEFNNNKSLFNFTREYIIASLHKSLKRLKTDYLDILLIHSDGRDEEIINSYQVFDTLSDLKKQGLIRAFGMSSKTTNGGILAVQTSDVVMVTLNLNYLEDIPVINEAYKLNKGVLIKKSLGSGYLQIQPSMDLIFRNKEIATKGIHSVILGTISPQHLREAAELV